MQRIILTEATKDFFNTVLAKRVLLQNKITYRPKDAAWAKIAECYLRAESAECTDKDVTQIVAKCRTIMSELGTLYDYYAITYEEYDIARDAVRELIHILTK